MGSENKKMIYEKNIYPIKFAPILQQKNWGGIKLASEFNKKTDLFNVGENWGF